MSFEVKLFINEKQYDANVRIGRHDGKFGNRRYAEITMQISYNEAVELFVNDLTWSVGYEDQLTTDYSKYSIAGPITDNRDGTITVLMGEPTIEEISSIPLAGDIPKTYKEAKEIRTIIETAMQSIDDDTALKVVNLYPKWTELIGKSVAVGFKFSHEGKLYKTLTDGDIFQSHWVPGVGTETLFIRINEVSAGTLEDPISYDGNMILENGKYYIQDEIVYLCNRDTIIAVYHALKDLVGMYVEVVG